MYIKPQNDVPSLPKFKTLYMLFIDNDIDFHFMSYFLFHSALVTSDKWAGSGRNTSKTSRQNKRRPKPDIDLREPFSRVPFSNGHLVNSIDLKS